MSRLDTFIEALRQHIDTEITEAERTRNADETAPEAAEADAYIAGLNSALRKAEVHQTSDMQHEVRVRPAFDCLEVQPCTKGSDECGTVHGKNHGRGAAYIEFAAYTPWMEVRLIVDTAWHHPKTPIDVRETYAGIGTTYTLAQLGYHFGSVLDLPMRGADLVGPVRAPDDCPRGWGECYSAVEFGHAAEGVDRLITGGTDALWPWLAEQLNHRMTTEGTN